MLMNPAFWVRITQDAVRRGFSLKLEPEVVNGHSHWALTATLPHKLHDGMPLYGVVMFDPEMTEDMLEVQIQGLLRQMENYKDEP